MKTDYALAHLLFYRFWQKVRPGIFQDRREFSLSPRERAGVRGKVMNLHPLLRILLLLLATALPSLADTTTASDLQNFPQHVPYELGDSEFAPGDNIAIQEIRGTSDTIKPGETYCVTGTYTLSSQHQANLSFFATTTNRTPTPIDPQQTVRITNGTGTFRLVKQVAEDGYLHLTFYSLASGHGFGGVYFGQGQWVLRDKHFSYRAEAPRPAETSPREPLSTNAPNQVLYDYLGDSVLPPTNLDTAYTKDGLTQAMQSAAQSAGISLAKLEIDDSEFPFLVGVVFAGNGDKQKFIEQIGKLAPYKSSGGVGGETSYAMNLVPYPAFPSQDSTRIYHRMMLREAILYDKINGVR
jgi:hypothetical protein